MAQDPNIIYRDLSAVVESDYVIETVVRRKPRNAKMIFVILPPDEPTASVARS